MDDEVEDIVAVVGRVKGERTRRELDKHVEPTIEQFFVPWDSISADDVQGYEGVLGLATDERPLQKYLESRPVLLVQHLGGGHGRWVIPQPRLGAEFVPDFMIAEKSSLGFEWTAVELENPSVSSFTQGGDPSAALSHAIRQIEDWRGWLTVNQAYADRPRDSNGLGLRNIDGEVPGLILIGRRGSSEPQNVVDRRRRLGHKLAIQVHTYDWLADMARGRVRALTEARLQLDEAAAESQRRDGGAAERDS